jgi:hypothetical protein
MLLSVRKRPAAARVDVDGCLERRDADRHDGAVRAIEVADVLVHRSAS